MKQKSLDKSRMVREIVRNRILFLMLLPAVIYYIIFCYLPMAGVVIAFKNYKYDLGIFGSDWVGFNNFSFFFKSGKAWLLTKNTILYNISFIITGLFFQVSLAIFISELKLRYFKKIAHSVIFLPYFISWVIVSAMAYNLFNSDYGVINNLLRSAGLEPVQIYGSAGAWKYLLVGFYNWKSIGYGSVVYLAVITGISPELYESSRLDGANVFQRIRHIVIPSLIPTIITLILLSLGGILRGNLDMFYQLVGNNSMLFNATDVIDTYVLRSVMGMMNIGVNYGISTAIGLYQQAIGFFLIITINFIIKRVNSDYVLF